MVTRNRLAQLRGSLTRAQLAAKLEPPPTNQTVANWETTGKIPRDRMYELSSLFGVSVEFLMGWDESDDDDPPEAA